MNSYLIGWRRMKSRMKDWRSLHYYTENIHFILLNWKYEKSFSLWHSGSPSLEGQSDGPLSPSDIQYCTSVIKSEAAYVMRRLTFCCLERKQPSRVGGSPLCDVVSSFLCHTHTDGKDKLLEWPDRSCLLLYVSARNPWNIR